MNNKDNMSQDPPLCANGCGFYGNPTTRNRCSKCYNELLKQTVFGPDSTSEPDNLSSGLVGEYEATSNKKASKRKNRCGLCKKRVGLTGFECRCGGTYCGSHRYPEEHSCPFDFKAFERDLLSKTLFAVAECKADKLHHRL